MADHALILITVGDKDEAGSIARRLVEERLAAGVQIVPIESIYTWQDEIIEDEEVLLIVKTRSDRFERVEQAVREMHSYEVPPIVMIDIAEAHHPYLAWIDQTVG